MFAVRLTNVGYDDAGQCREGVALAVRLVLLSLMATTSCAKRGDSWSHNTVIANMDIRHNWRISENIVRHCGIIR